MTMIQTNLIIGSLDESFDHVLLDTYNITHVLNTASEVNITKRVDRVYEKHGVPDDCHDSDIRSIIDESIKFIEDAHKNDGVVFVHCLEGKSRSVCVVVAYMVRVLRWNFNDALSYISSVRPHIDPFPSYMEQTREYCHS